MASRSPLTSPLSGKEVSHPAKVDTTTPNLVAEGAAPTSLSLLRRRLLIIFSLALGLRVFVVLWLNFAPKAYQPAMAIFADDAVVYDQIAKNILHGQGYQYAGNYAEISRIPPLFSFFLAGLYALWGPSVVGTGLANALLGALTAVCLYYLVLRCLVYYQVPTVIAAERIAFIAACLFAIYPLEIFNTPYVLKENFSIFLTVGFALAWAQLLPVEVQQPTRWWAVVAGVLLGLSVLSRYTHIGLILFFVAGNLWWCWRNGRTIDEQSKQLLSRSLLFNTGIAV
ncbi:MAG: glycosyltransferase family 39 protein, partial [Abitibacteriaceae bacterium]|nr:glycosyltransferase family 39 protein [Abditibacteriaceae bacterium]